MTFFSLNKIENEKAKHIINVLIFIFSCFLTQVAITSLLVVFTHYVLKIDNFVNLYTYSFIGYLPLIPIIIFFSKKWNIKSLPDLNPINFKIVIIILFTSIIIFLFNPIISEPFNYFKNATNGKILVSIPKNINLDFQFIFSFLSYVIVAPIIEEIIHRGMVFNYLKRIFKVKNAIIISSFLFAIIHFQFSGEGIIKLIYGLVFCISYQKTKSLITPITFHILINLISHLTMEQIIEATAINLSRYIPLMIFSILFIYFLIKGLYDKNKLTPTTYKKP